MTSTLTQRDRLADVRQRARELRERRTRAREFHGAARDAASNYSGDDIQNSEEFLRLERASGDLNDIGNVLELVEAEERFVLSPMAGIEGPVADARSCATRRCWAELSEADTSGERALRAHFVLRRPIDNGLLCWLPVGEPICFDDPIAVLAGIERDVLPRPKPDARGSCNSNRGAIRSPRKGRKLRETRV